MTSVCRKKIFGPPGCGKTTRLLQIMEDEMNRGTPPDRIAFVSFTKKAADEAKERAKEKFHLEDDDLPYFRTLHSLAFNEMGIQRSEVLQPSHWKEIADCLGISFSGNLNPEDGVPLKKHLGDVMLFIYNLSHVRCQPIIDTHHYFPEAVSWARMKQFNTFVNLYKQEKNLYDFNDMLTIFDRSIPVEVAIIDEAQDLSPLQWQVVQTAFGKVPRLYMAGDDDQAIYKWAGADAAQFLGQAGDIEVLDQSYRLPRAVWEVADKLSHRIEKRQEKRWRPRDEQGAVRYWDDPEKIDFSKGSWLLLARNKYLLNRFEQVMNLDGYLYSTRRGSSVDHDELSAILSWEALNKGKAITLEQVRQVYSYLRADIGVSREHITMGQADPKALYTRGDLAQSHGLRAQGHWFEVLLNISIKKRQYYRSALRRGESLSKKPRIHIDTIHGVKGGEADNVVLCSDLSARSLDELTHYPDEAHRVFYVGATRARHNLHILFPQTAKSYRI